MYEPFSKTVSGYTAMELEVDKYHCPVCENDYCIEMLEDGLCGNCTDHYKKCEHCENYFHVDDMENGLCESCQERLRLERISQETFENSHGYGKN